MFFHLARNMVNGKLDVIVVGRIDSTAGEVSCLTFYCISFYHVFLIHQHLGTTKLAGGFKDFLFSPVFGEDSHFDYIMFFSDGLKPPTRRC